MGFSTSHQRRESPRWDVILPGTSFLEEQTKSSNVPSPLIIYESVEAANSQFRKGKLVVQDRNEEQYLWYPTCFYAGLEGDKRTLEKWAEDERGSSLK